MSEVLEGQGVEADISAADNQNGLARIIFASTFGTIVEWYDFFVYGTAAALVFGKLFFPASDPVVSTLSGLSVYAVGYVARPLGGIIFGHFGDRVGRRSMLVLSMLLMGGGTLLVGLLPTYEQIGIAAPILLVALRLVQAIGLGGEWGGAVLMVAESAPPKRRGFYGSLVQLGNPIGRTTATFVFALTSRLPSDAFLAWGWRIPFLASAILIGIALVVRYQLIETPAFEKLKSRKNVSSRPVMEALTVYRRQTLIALGLKISEVAWVGILSIFAISYLTKDLGMSKEFVLGAVATATFVELLTMPLAGWLSDIVGRRPIYFAGALFGLLFAFPMFWLFQTKDPTIVMATMILGVSLGQGIVFALHASFLPELFAAKVRYSGISLGFQIGAAIGGGLTPLAAAAAVEWSGGATWPVSVMMMGLALMTMIALSKARVAPEENF